MINTETKRKQYTDQDSFRWSTPNPQVATRTVDAYVQQVHKEFVKPTGAGQITPIAPSQLPALIRSAQKTRMPGYHHPPGGGAIADADPTVPLLNFLGTAIELTSRIAQDTAKTSLREAVVEYQELRDGGLTHLEAMEQARPETIFGLAENAYESNMGAAQRKPIGDAMQAVYDDPANRHLSPEEMGYKVKDVYLDAVAGTSETYRAALGNLGAQTIDNAMLNQTQRLKQDGIQKHRDAFRQAVPQTLDFLNMEYADASPELKAEHARRVVSAQQEQNSFVGISKIETSMDVITAQGNHILQNPRNYPGGVEDAMGWVFVPDEQGVTAFSNPEVAKAYMAYDTKFASKLQALTHEEAIATQKIHDETYAKHKNFLIDAKQEGRTVTTADFMDRLDADRKILSLREADILEAEFKEMSSPYPKENADFIAEQFLDPMAFGQTEAFTREEVLARRGDMDETTFRKINIYLTSASEPAFKEDVSFLKATFVSPTDEVDRGMSPLGKAWMNPMQQKAIKHYTSEVQKATEAAEGAAIDPKTLEGIKMETLEWMKKQPDERPTAPPTTYEEAREQKPDLTLDEWQATLEEAVAKEEEKRKVIRKATPVKVEQKIQEQKAERPQKPMEQIKQEQGTLRPSSAQNWINDNIEATLKDLPRVAKELENPIELAKRISHDYLGGKYTQQLTDFIGKIVGDRFSADAAKNKEFMQGQKPQVQESTYVDLLATQENGPLMELPDDALIMPNKPPEDAPDGEMDIGFGHKITPEEAKSGEIHGIPFEDGISKDEAKLILQEDVKVHRDRAEESVGTEQWNSLDPVVQDILTDYSFTGSLEQFPKFKKALLTGDYDTALKEYVRYARVDGQMVPLGQRNDFIRSILEDLQG